MSWMIVQGKLSKMAVVKKMGSGECISKRED